MTTPGLRLRRVTRKEDEGKKIKEVEVMVGEGGSGKVETRKLKEGGRGPCSPSSKETEGMEFGKRGTGRRKKDSKGGVHFEWRRGNIDEGKEKGTRRKMKDRKSGEARQGRERRRKENMGGYKSGWEGGWNEAFLLK